MLVNVFPCNCLQVVLKQQQQKRITRNISKKCLGLGYQVDMSSSSDGVYLHLLLFI